MATKKAVTARRPNKYTPELGAKLYEAVAEGAKLDAVCRRRGMPSKRTVNNWLKRHPEFGIAMYRARIQYARSLYSDEMADVVCFHVARGLRLHQVSALPGMPDADVLEVWLYAFKDFEEMYREAGSTGAHLMAEETIAIADQGGDARLRVNARQWLSERRNRHAYGDEFTLKATGEVRFKFILEEMAKAGRPRLPADDRDEFMPDEDEGVLVLDQPRSE